MPLTRRWAPLLVLAALLLAAPAVFDGYHTGGRV
jgi:hypothetical protein